MLDLSNFYFCHYVFKKLSAADASESVYMRERDNHIQEELDDLRCFLVFEKVKKYV